MRIPWRLVPFVFAALLAALAIGTILEHNAGRLTYTLDDPYIHLALSESIAGGRYGIEPGEPSAPSSSILWPFLLAPGAGFASHGVLPLLLGLAALFATLELLTRLVERCGLDRGPGGPAFAAGLLSILVLTLNLVGLVLTGMEHSLQVALAAAVLLGMVAVHRGAPTPLYLTAAIIAGPLVRYESATLSVAALALLAVCGRWRAAAFAAAGCVALVAGFSVFLSSLGLEPLPTPVLESLERTGGSGWLPGPEHVWVRLKAILWMRSAAMLAVFTGALVAVAAICRRDARLLLAGAIAPALHLGFGKLGGFGRYEIYVLTSAVALLLFGLRGPLRTLVASRGAAVSLLAIGAVLLPALSDTAAVVYRSPRAAHNIYQQQHQLHRFVTAYYRKAVAVNDLGRVSYRNPEYVLDLWGLTAADVRHARLTGAAEWPAVFVERRRIELALIYDSWFEGRLPTAWRRLARLHLRGKRITPASSTVSFYATRPEAVGEILEALRRFRDTLPADAELEIGESQNTRPLRLQ